MGTGVDLLRLLEPVVRPGASAGPARAPRAPLEARSFESLLEEAKAQEEGGGEAGDAAAAAARPAGLLDGLSRVDRIENPSLRLLLKGSGGSGGGA